jgi:hypothetical protein
MLLHHRLPDLILRCAVRSGVAFPPDVVLRAHELDAIARRMTRHMCKPLSNDVYQLMDSAVTAKVFP